ncbi:MAG: radical SAM protein [Clostridia bacterium]|nr:radical SAM protein [Clostridia bacterium]
MAILGLKRLQLENVAKRREELKKEPNLRWLFFELTNRCNLKCRHCGSNCSSSGETLSLEDINNTLESINDKTINICLTGGEPLLHPNFFEIASLIKSKGFLWGMTTNATLIDYSTALKLKDVGMSSVSVSLDGMEISHDCLRRKKGAWKLALRGLESLQKAGFKPQVTTVLHSANLNELETFYNFLCEIGITNWRPINVEPIGRACESNDFALSHKEFANLIRFIRKKRFDYKCKMNVTFGCSHYLGLEQERMVRDHYFLCGAGILVASVRSNGDICACLDIANSPELVQGNVKRDNFMEVWKNGFKTFRCDRTLYCQKCLNCKERFICGGDSAHTWNYESNEPLFCYKDYSSALRKNTSR